MGSIAGLVFLTVSLCLLLPPTSALKCWHNSDHTPAATWSIQECDVEKNETACLMQYCLYNGQQLPSFSGCHTPKMRCNYCCDPTEGQDNDFSCCCSGDLCNEFHPPRPHCHDHDDPIIDALSLCAAKGCDHYCVEHNGEAHCYCKGGDTLDSNGTTCIDLDECAHNNGGCKENCHNEVGTGYKCSCQPRYILKDGYRCEPYSGLICDRQTCNGTGCSPKTLQYCDNVSNTTPHCQATYKYDKNNGYQVRLLSCFSGAFPCTEGGCTLRDFGSNIFYCCCNDNNCNSNITFP